MVLPATLAFLDFAKPIDGGLASALYLIRVAEDLSKSVPDIMVILKLVKEYPI